MEEELKEELEDEIEEEEHITTKQLISRLLELDPDGTKEIYLEFSDDEWYSEWADKYNFQIDDKNHNIIKIVL